MKSTFSFKLLVLLSLLCIHGCAGMAPSPGFPDGEETITNRVNDIQLGMPKSTVKAMLGDPSGTKIVQTANGQSETWAYSFGTLMSNVLVEQQQFRLGWKYASQHRSPYFIRATVTFTDGIVTQIEK